MSEGAQLCARENPSDCVGALVKGVCAMVWVGLRCEWVHVNVFVCVCVYLCACVGVWLCERRV